MWRYHNPLWDRVERILWQMLKRNVITAFMCIPSASEHDYCRGFWTGQIADSKITERNFEIFVSPEQHKVVSELTRNGIVLRVPAQPTDREIESAILGLYTQSPTTAPKLQ